MSTLLPVLLVLAMATAAPATAPLTGDGPDSVETAETLYQEAIALFAQPAKWKKAADLLHESANERTIDDPERYHSLTVAARIYVHVKKYDAAGRALRQAADEAAAIGDVANAAAAYLDAAYLSAKVGDPAQMETYLKKAELLSHSPYLSAAERTAISSRLPAKTVATR